MFISDCVFLCRWTIPYLEKSKQDRANILLFKLQKVKPIDIKYNEYNWNLNLPRLKYDPNEVHPNDLMEMENNATNKKSWKLLGKQMDKSWLWMLLLFYLALCNVYGM